MRHGTRKKFYSLFSWLHPNGNAIPTIIGAITNIGLKLFEPSLLRIKQNEYHDYVSHMYNSRNRKMPWNTYLGCHMIYGVDPVDYYSYDFPHKNDSGRSAYITDVTRKMYYHAFNGKFTSELFDNKYNTYLKFKEFYKRDVVLCDGDDTLESVTAFVARHPRFILKPINAFMGKGVKIYETIGDPESCLESIRSNAPCVLEEIIEPSDKMRALHPSSLNTLRIPCIRGKDGLHIVCPFLRVGTGESVVDGGHYGGLWLAIDVETGIVGNPAVNIYGYEFLYHPDTHIPLVGFQLPDWDGAVALVRKLMDVVPQINYVGWDLAHTASGWIMVEGNDNGQFVGQVPLRRGCRAQVDEILSKLR